MKLEKVKQKIKDGYCDEAISNMSGMAVEDIAKLREPKKATARAPVPRKEAPKPPAEPVAKKPSPKET